MLQLVNDRAMRDRLVEAARDRARLFDWKSSAQQLLALYAEALSEPKRCIAAAMG